jgi:hypothetical protein
MPIKIKNKATEKYLQVTKQFPLPHLSNQQDQCQIHLKSYRKGHIHIENLWITNDSANYLQNGDLIVLQNKNKNSYIAL